MDNIKKKKIDKNEINNEKNIINLKNEEEKKSNLNLDVNNSKENEDKLEN